MGGVNSCWLPRYQNPNHCQENHSTPKMKSKGHRRNLSAAFNLADMDNEMIVEQLNINVATEEQLMTLPGINRQTAKNIVEYRRQIGGFKKVEDLALVSGVGATKLGIIRPEICVGRKKISQNSSQSSSVKDLSTLDTTSRCSTKSHTRNLSASFPKVNINTSNVFQLMKVKCISQQLGENIVAYRDKKGPFRVVDDLLKVKGINSAVLSAIRPYLVITDDTPPSSVTDSVSHYSHHSHRVHSHNRTHSYTNGIVPCVGDSPVVLPSQSGSEDEFLNLYGPISRKSMRRKKSPLHLKKEGQSVIRIASWNLQQFTKEKADNPGVKEVICMTILENGLSIIAVQDIYEDEALKMICDELNKPTIPNIKKWPGFRGIWRHVSGTQAVPNKPHLAVLYDTTCGVQVMKKTDLPVLLSPQSSSPLLTVFKKGNWEVLLANIHIQGAAPSKSDITLFADALVQKAKEWCVDNSIILGDTGSAAMSEDFKDSVESLAFKCVTKSECQATEDRTIQFQATDQIWMDEKSYSTIYSGESGQVREGLTSPWIPRGWMWGGTASDHAPVWLQLVTDSQLTPTPTHNSLSMLKMAMPLVSLADS